MITKKVAEKNDHMKVITEKNYYRKIITEKKLYQKNDNRKIIKKWIIKH